MEHDEIKRALIIAKLQRDLGTHRINRLTTKQLEFLIRHQLLHEEAQALMADTIIQDYLDERKEDPT